MTLENLYKKLVEYEQDNTSLKEENDFLRKQVEFLKQQLFGKKSEKRPVDDYPFLFDLPEPEFSAEEPEVEEEEKVEVKPHTRKKGRKPLPANLPTKDVVLDIPDEKKLCPCGCTMQQIGEEVSEKLEHIPEQFLIIRIIRPKYACRHCEGVEGDGQSVKIAPPLKQFLPKSLPTAALAAIIICRKYCDALPFYRQERIFERVGIDISRANMSNWAIRAAERCNPLLELMEEEIRGGPLINIDETTVQVLREPGRKAENKSYMWVRRGGAPGHPVVLFHYSEGRAGAVAKGLLAGYSGVVQTDGYVAYGFLDNLQETEHVACWAHARRRFMKIAKIRGKKAKTGAENVALNYIGKLYDIEKEATRCNLDAADRVVLRRKKALPILQEFKKWLEKKRVHVPPKSTMGEAVSYTLGQWKRLVNYVDHAEVSPDNNMAENAIRPFVVGRKNWLFAGSPQGAKASAFLYSLLESAKANGLEPYAYLRFLFERIPFAECRKDYVALLPTRLKNEELVVEPGSGV